MVEFIPNFYTPTTNIKELEDIKEKRPTFEEDFSKFVEEQSTKSSTWKFWKQFVFEDCFAYVSLFLSIRTGDWDLRMAAMKSMASLFTAFDRPTYQKLISKHIADIQTMPTEALTALQSGGFVVNIQGRTGHSIGIDEAHEMCINKNCKEYITRPSTDYINRIACFLPIRAKAMKNIEAQTFSDRKKCPTESVLSIYTKHSVTCAETNVKAQVTKLENSTYASATGSPMENMYEQYIELPRALATSDGEPNKGSKANTTKVYEKRYDEVSPPVFSNLFPTGWVPSTVIMEGMFLINISPWSAHKSMGEYAEFLLKQHILPHYRNGSTEVHLLFDDPDGQALSPKYFERQQRDKKNPTSEQHCCSDFTDDMLIPPKWRQDVLNCRKCKRNLVRFLAHTFLTKIKRRLQPEQKFVTAGGFQGTDHNKAMFVKYNSIPQYDHELTSNAEESDYRIWRHVTHSQGQRKLVMSPDTDVYHIGMPFMLGTQMEVFVQLSPFTSQDLRLINLQALLNAFQRDPDLAPLPKPQIPPAMQSLFVSTGCDFISFFHGYGKASFLNTLFEYCEFICSNSGNKPGTLSTMNDQSTLSFYRLVGCAYFRKHRSAFLPTYPSPFTVFNSLVKEDQTPVGHHSDWLQFLRERLWSKIKYEEEMIPSDEALKRHWKRTTWVLTVWRQATNTTIIYPPLVGNGWTQPDANCLGIDWDSESNVAQVRSRVSLIKKGCTCKTGCRTARCGCKKCGHHCGPGCTCVTCCNLPMQSNTNEEVDVEVAELIEHSDSDIDDEVDDNMYSVFGPSESELGGPGSDSEVESDLDSDFIDSETEV